MKVMESQEWAAFLVLTGMGFLAFCLWFHYPAEVGAGVIGAGLAMFQASAKQTTNVNAPNATTQQITTSPNHSQPEESAQN